MRPCTTKSSRIRAGAAGTGGQQARLPRVRVDDGEPLGISGVPEFEGHTNRYSLPISGPPAASVCRPWLHCRQFPVSQQVAAREVSFPMYPEMTEPEVLATLTQYWHSIRNQGRRSWQHPRNSNRYYRRGNCLFIVSREANVSKPTNGTATKVALNRLKFRAGENETFDYRGSGRSTGDGWTPHARTSSTNTHLHDCWRLNESERHGQAGGSSSCCLTGSRLRMGRYQPPSRASQRYSPHPFEKRMSWAGTSRGRRWESSCHRNRRRRNQQYHRGSETRVRRTLAARLSG